MTDEKDNQDEEHEEEQPEQALIKPDNGEDDDPDIADIIELEKNLEKAPPQVRKMIEMFMGMSVTQRVNPQQALFEKFTDAHIDKYLDHLQRDDDHEYELAKGNRWFSLFYVILALGAFVFAIVFLLPNDRDLLILLLQFLALLFGGLGAGYGIAKRRSE